MTPDLTAVEVRAFHQGRAEAYADALRVVEEWVANTRPRYHTDLLAVLTSKRDGSEYAMLVAAPKVPARKRGAP